MNSNDLICCITMTYPRDPVMCPCGHLFDREAIYTWLERSGTCPVSRNALSINDLADQEYVLVLLRRYDLLSKPIKPYSSSAVPLAYSFMEGTTIEQDLSELGVEGRPRIVDIREHLCNPQTGNDVWYTISDRWNISFRNAVIPDVRMHGLVVCRRYIDHSDSLVALCRRHGLAGRFMYDCFLLAKHTWVVELAEFDRYGRPIPLEFFEST